MVRRDGGGGDGGGGSAASAEPSSAFAASAEPAAEPATVAASSALSAAVASPAVATSTAAPDALGTPMDESESELEEEGSDAEYAEYVAYLGSLLTRARKDEDLTKGEWSDLLSGAAADALEPTVGGGQPPLVSTRRRVTDDGVTPKMQYHARLMAWDCGLPQPAEPPISRPCLELPDATARNYTALLSAEECAERKREFIG